MSQFIFQMPEKKLDQLLDRLASLSTLYVPLEKHGQVQFTAYEPQDDQADLRFDALNTVRSAKDFFFPQHEDLVAFKTRDKNIEIIDNRKQTTPYVVMGIRACDMKSFDVLDQVFLSDPVDTYYAERRKQGILITQACGRPEESCFCSNFDVDAANPGGDIAIWITAATLFWQPLTEKGKMLTDKVADLFKQTEDLTTLTDYKQQIAANINQLPLKDLDLSRFRPDNQKEVFESPVWDQISEACIGCGTCTFVCPTCQCYDIRDYDTGKGIQRYRCWDSCMYSDFVLMAHGNPRTSQVERFRQRFMHKLIYTPANQDGIYGCVGCGRCLTKCPSAMNIVKVIQSFGGEAHVYK